MVSLRFLLLKTAHSLIVRIIPENSALFRWLFLLGLRLTASVRHIKRKGLRVGIHLADHCNLNCIGCGHFSCIVEKKFCDYGSFNRDMERLGSLTNGTVEIMELMGGEPLLHPELTSFLVSARKNFPNGIITIVTNGILLEKQEDNFWESCQQNNISVTITRYPIEINFEDLQHRAKPYNVVVQWQGGALAPVKAMWKFPLDVSGSQNPKKSFRQCAQGNYCIMLREGRIYTCPIVPYIEHFNKRFNLDLKATENDSVSIYDADSIDTVFDFLRNPIPFCKYCNLRKTEIGIDWRISSKNISEWI